ncbi:MAG: 2-dehydropantoate 2-reductase [Bauldia sp.]
MRICIIGAGAMGSLYGAMLARSGQEIVLFDAWADHIDAVQRNGLRLTGITGDFTTPVAATTRVEEIGPVDLCLVHVNAYATSDAGRIAAAVLKPDGFCLTLQNGVGNVEKLDAVLGQARVMGGLSYHSAALEGPGVAMHTHAGPTWLGERDGKPSARLERLVAAFREAGFTPTVVDDIMGFIWGKFIHNCSINPICAAMGIRVGEIPMYPSADEFQTRIIEETLAVLKTRGIKVPEEDPLQAIKRFCKVKFNKPSMLQHVERGRRTEIDSLNGVVVEEGRRLEVPTPFSEALVLMVRTLDARNAYHAKGEPDFDRLEAERKAEFGAV